MGLCISKKSKYLYGESYNKSKSDNQINRLFSEYQDNNNSNYGDIVFSSSSDISSGSTNSSVYSSSISSSNNSSSKSDFTEVRKHWNNCKVAEIKIELRRRNLKLSGKKSELIERILIDYYKNQNL